jgi:hypothetical protein
MQVSPAKSTLSTYAALANQSNLITETQLSQIREQRRIKEVLKYDKSQRLLEQSKKIEAREKNVQAPSVCITPNKIIEDKEIEKITEIKNKPELDFSNFLSLTSLDEEKKILVQPAPVPAQEEIVETDNLEEKLQKLREQLSLSSKIDTETQNKQIQEDNDRQRERDELNRDEMRTRLAEVGARKYNDRRYDSKSYRSSDDDRKRKDELSYFREKANMEEEAAIRQAGMLLNLMSTFTENLAGTVGFNAIKLTNLAENMESGLENGDFDLAIKSYISKPETLSMLQNPLLSFGSSFASIISKTHADNVKRELQQGLDGFRSKKKHENETRKMNNRENKHARERSKSRERVSKSLERSRRRESSDEYSRRRRYSRSRSRDKYYRRSRSRRRSLSNDRNSRDYRRRSRSQDRKSKHTKDNNISDDKAFTATTIIPADTAGPAKTERIPFKTSTQTGPLNKIGNVIEKFTPFLGTISTAIENENIISAKKDELEKLRPKTDFI